MKISDIKGQEQAIRILRKEFLSGRHAQAYLFAGPEGVGKKSTAMAFARLLNCEKPDRDEADSCGECLQCRKFSSGNHPDFELVVPEEDKVEINIDRIRELQKSAALKPMEGKKKVYVVDSANDMRRDSANCMLKTLEEPNENVVLILVARNMFGILPTIRSRCRAVRFRSIPERVLAELLAVQKGLSPGDAEKLASFSQGSLSQALLYAEGKLNGVSEFADEIMGLVYDDASADEAGYVRAMKVSEAVSKDRGLARDIIRCLVVYLRKNFLQSPREGLKRDMETMETVLYTGDMLERNMNVAIAFSGMLLKMMKR